MITADQLYEEYMADEAAADAQYKGEQTWVIEAKVFSYLESESGNYLMMEWCQPDEVLIEVGSGRTIFLRLPGYSNCSVKLEPQFSEGFKDVGDGYIVEIVGECQGISEGVITVKSNQIDKTRGALPPRGLVEY